mmetsp:Transcript_31678/g.57702  ORF Transcript_31678/g.57702 Transcript_31678/m.57702 type:complete len:263 (-) Transcript_31678:206-994(-)|eukprot:CAMPEP_0197630678 /NCGR_PEP_ID=MMETSP1338-20131121/8082_1 /TAXON_ID=43686 ORGANISM="Pelagodinium beii, Strain RCC1491" /NCGR_SAMPLE_ID=MMETSP1338 /ASSEMBLY_ACC=CAM_ASM_000754 /LENGTH=262 /DNA_ID=CAMNT_0043201945 /DNA_START=107 /DNA_END=895 /DNA_ORIENTATION=+
MPLFIWAQATSHAFKLAFTMVSMAEVFDKTWFVALVMAMRFPTMHFTVFWGCFAALLVHVVLAAVFGYSISRFLSVSQLDFLAAGVYGVFTVMYGYDWYKSEAGSDVIAAGKEEIEEEISQEVEGAQYGTVAPKKPTQMEASLAQVSRVFWQCFMVVLIAEFGDRTQIAMIGVHASQPLLPVMWGSAAAFGMLTLSAVAVSSFLDGRKLSQSFVKAAIALSFAAFTLVAVHDGMKARGHEMQSLPHLFSLQFQVIGNDNQTM